MVFERDTERKAHIFRVPHVETNLRGATLVFGVAQDGLLECQFGFSFQNTMVVVMAFAWVVWWMADLGVGSNIFF